LDTGFPSKEYVVICLQVENSSRLDDLLSSMQPAAVREVLDEKTFRRMVAIERKRTERTAEPFLLMLLECADSQQPGNCVHSLDKLTNVLLSVTRETDVVGWHKEHQAIGILFTGLAPDCKNTCIGAILNRVSTVLQDKLFFEQFVQLSISLHLFPDDWNHEVPGNPSNPTLYRDLHQEDKNKRAMLALKRTMDVLGSVFLLILFLPLFVLIAAAVKATSKGPVFFRQQRVGQYGQCFTFLKFRSMRDGNSHSAHMQYAKQMISGSAKPVSIDENGEGVYKLINDPRITRLGRFLRRTSLDELPQFLNVLRGDMSLVGPRPPIPYEVAAYQTWHRRRVLDVKPGITGLWQVTGRSRVNFDEMVRLDLQYANSWSPWLDFKILMRTPAAMLRGAY
jgi:lipopolysaccharide/colanic/teichoic acid biosynthesis glycosyltransferase